MTVKYEVLSVMVPCHRIFPLLALWGIAVALVVDAAEISSDRARRVFVSLPVNPPIFVLEGAGREPSLAERLDTLVTGLGHADSKERRKFKKQLTALVLENGTTAVEVLAAAKYRARPNPLVLPSCRELMRRPKTGGQLRKYSDDILRELKLKE